MSSIDLVYVLGSGSAWHNNELRFSLRSVERNLSGVRHIYVVGEDPGFLTDQVKYIHHPDPLHQNADGNMALKILRACQEEELSEDFLFMNDDFIIARPIEAYRIPWLHKGNFKDRTEKFWKAQFYRYRLHRTYLALKERNLPTLQYDYHAPMLMNRLEFPRVMAQFDFEEGIGYTFRSLYGNVLALPAIPVDGHKVTIYNPYTVDQINRRVGLASFVGYNDEGLNDALKIWLWQQFPRQSRYEKDACNDIVIRIAAWMESERDYQEGVEIFCDMVKSRNLQLLFRSRETPSLHAKLTYKLTSRIKDVL